MTGSKNTAIALSISDTVNSLTGPNGDGTHNSMYSLVVSAIPVGAVLTDGSNSFTATAGHTSVNVNGWTLTSLKITPPTGFLGNFTLTVTGTETDAEGNLSASTTAIENVTVIANVNHAPAGTNNTVTTLEDTATSSPLSTSASAIRTTARPTICWR